MKRLSKYLPATLLWLICCSPIGQPQEAELPLVKIDQAQKHRGTHFFSVREGTDFEPLRQNNLEWLTLVPWGFQEGVGGAEISHHDGDSLHMKQHEDHWVRNIALARAAGFKVFLKPHLWIHNPPEGKWRSDIYPPDDKVWQEWQRTYSEFILRYAKVAERAEAEMFCIGTEFTSLTLKKPEFWRDLIQEIRKVYSGQITYAANWYEEFEQISFWDQMDFIGIQAYFPLVDHHNPNVPQLVKAWDEHLPAIESTQKKYNRPILFTEMGYRSTASGAIRPWEWRENIREPDSLYSPQTQANCYQAFFDVFWEQDWFAGVHIWQMRSDFVAKPEQKDQDFFPQGKPAEQIIAKGFE